MRINVLYFLDSLLDSSIALGSHDAPYAAYVNRDLGTIVERVVPPEREGVLNLKSARQVGPADPPSLNASAETGRGCRYWRVGGRGGW